MKTIVFAGEIGQASDGRYRVEALRTGKWNYPGLEDGGFEITEATLDEMIARFKAGEKGPEVPLNRDHDDAKPCGWVKDVEKAPGRNGGPSLWAYIDITDDGTRKLVDDKSLRYASSELDFGWVNPEACRTAGDCAPRQVFEGLALTNRPYVKGLSPVEPVNLSDFAASGCGCGGQADDNEKEKRMTLEEMQKENERLKASLAEKDATTETRLAEERKAREASDARLRALEHTTALDKARDRVKRLVTRGRITPAVGMKALRFAEVLVLGDASRVTLATPVKIKLAEGKEEEVTSFDCVGELLNLLDEMPDSIATETDLSEFKELDPDVSAKTGDAKLMERAKEIREKNPKLDQLAATAQAAEELGIHKNRGGER
jgi:hypothetical protein